MSPKIGRTQVERTEKAVSALRAAALELLLEQGFARLNLNDVGQRAGYSRGIIHYHFGSKDALLVDLLNSLTASVEGTFSQIQSTGAEGLTAIFSALADDAGRQPSHALARILLLNEGAGSSNPSVVAHVVRYNHIVREVFERHLSACPEALRGSVSPQVLAAGLLGTVRGLYHQWLAEREKFDIVGNLTAIAAAFRQMIST